MRPPVYLLRPGIGRDEGEHLFGDVQTSRRYDSNCASS